MQTIFFTNDFDTTFTPNIKNLCKRNGTFYYRKQVDGKRVLKSLKTDDVFLAVHRLRQALAVTSGQKEQSKNKTTDTIFQPTSEHINQIQSEYPVEESKSVECNTKKKHKMADIWDSIYHGGQPLTQARAQSCVDRVIKFLGCKYIEDLDENPDLVYDMLDKFRKVRVKAGRSKGQTLGIKTIKEYIMHLRQIINYAEERDWIENAYKLKNRLTIRKIKGFSQSTPREPLAEPDFEILFNALFRMMNGDTDFLVNHKLKSYQKQYLNRVLKHPQAFVWCILICLFTGSRAGATTTIRHNDIDLENLTISICKNQSLVNRDDIREKCKRLKTTESERKVPIADILVKLGFLDYLKEQRKKYGPNSFIFEEVVRNKNREGYRPYSINESVNALFIVLGIKPVDASAKFLLDMHSLKESFYSHNDLTISKDMLEAIAGNRPSGRGLSSRIYNKQSFSRLPTKMILAVNQITYPHLGLLFGGKLPAELEHLNITY